MTRILIKKDKIFNLLWIAFAISAFVASTPRILAREQTPEEALNTLLASPSLNKNQTAVFIWDIEGDCRVVAHRASSPIVPASVMKCVSTAELRSCMSPKESLVTKIYIDGKIKDGLLNGNLVAVGAGDPSLGDGRHKSQPDFLDEITEALKEAGISGIDGKIIVDDDFFQGSAVHPSWPSADLSQSYGTGSHAFNFEGNASGKAAVKNPAAVFIKKLKTRLSGSGINVNEKEIASEANSRKLILEYASPALGNLMCSCMFRSDNLYAETFLRLFGVKNGSDGSLEGSAAVAMQHWEALNLPMDGVDIQDGSGLSRDNRLTAEFLGSVLLKMKDDPDYLTFFPLVGEEGTVRNFMKDSPLQGRMGLKTGSMNGIQSYAGYVFDEDYMPTHVVVVMTNDLKNRDSYRQALKNFFLTLFIK